MRRKEENAAILISRVQKRIWQVHLQLHKKIVPCIPSITLVKPSHLAVFKYIKSNHIKKGSAINTFPALNSCSSARKFLTRQSTATVLPFSGMPLRILQRQETLGTLHASFSCLTTLKTF